MKLFFLTFILIISDHILFSQQNNWERIYGLPNRYEKCYNIVRTYDEGFLLSIVFLSDSTYGEIKYSSWLLKTDINGFPIWSKYFYNPYYMFITCSLESSENGDIILTGQTNEVDDNGDAFIMRINPCGEKIWCKYLHFPDVNYGWRVKHLTERRYLLQTLYASNDWTIEGNQLWILDSNGTVISYSQIVPNYNYPYLKWPGIYDVIITSDNGYLLPGWGYIQDTASPQQWYRLQQLLVKTDSNGNESWMRPDSLNLEYVGALESCSELNNKYYAVGYTKDLIPKWYPYFSRLNTNGEIEYEKVLHPDTLLSTIIGILIGNNNSFYQLGHSFYTGNGPVFTTIFKTDTLNNLLVSIENFNGTSNIGAFTHSLDYKFLNAGYTPIDYSSANQVDAWAMKVNENLEYDTLYEFPFLYDSLCPFPITTDTVDCDCDLITGFGEPVKLEDRYELKVFPNPAGEVIHFKFHDRAGDMERDIKEIIFFDLMGKPVLKAEIGKEVSLNVSHLPAGVYVAIVLHEMQVITREKVVIIH